MRRYPVIIIQTWILILIPGLAFATVGFETSFQNSYDVARNAGRLIVNVSAPDEGRYEIVSTREGHLITMEGCGYLKVPGKPMLPSKNFMIALPPAARVTSVHVEDMGYRELPGTYRIVPTTPLILLAGSAEESRGSQPMREEWIRNRETANASDRPYPSQRGRLTGQGSLRKYSYAEVSYSPFSYHPLSGKIVFFYSARITLTYTLPLAGSAEAARIEDLKRDTHADAIAARLFDNYHHMEEAYAPEEEPVLAMHREAWKRHTYDYMIITRSDLAPAITSSEFITWKRSLGYHVKVILTDDPRITVQPGRDLAEQIRNFLRAYYLLWGTEYVLLVGDYEAVPMRYCYPDPNNHWHDPYDPGTMSGEVPTDYYYADLSLPDSLSWDQDGDGYPGEYGQDSPDFLADVYVGRIPTNNTARIAYTLDKLVSFEQDTGNWKNRALNAGAILFYENQDYSGYPRIDGVRCLELIESDCMDGWTISHYSEQDGLDPSYYPWKPLTLTAFPTDWRNGQYGIVNWSGHGAPDGAYRTVWIWDDGDGVAETNGSDVVDFPAILGDWMSLEDDYPSIVFGISCDIGYPEPNPQGNLGIDLLTEPGFGASAGVVSSARPAAISADWQTTMGGSESICYEFNRFMIDGPDGPRKLGEALYDGKYYAHQNYGWDHYAENLNLFNFNLYGDPSLMREGIE